MAIAFLIDFSLPRPLCTGQTQDLRRIVFDFAWLATQREAIEATCKASNEIAYVWLRDIFAGYSHLLIGSSPSALREELAIVKRCVKLASHRYRKRMNARYRRAVSRHPVQPFVIAHLVRCMRVGRYTRVRPPCRSDVYASGVAMVLIRKICDKFPHMSFNDVCLRHAHMSKLMWLIYACNDESLLQHAVSVGEFTIEERMKALLIWHQIQSNHVNFDGPGDDSDDESADMHKSINYRKHARLEKILELDTVLTDELVRRGNFPLLISRALRGECAAKKPFIAFGNAYRAGLVKERIGIRERLAAAGARVAKWDWIMTKAGEIKRAEKCGRITARRRLEIAGDIWEHTEKWTLCDKHGMEHNYDLYCDDSIAHMWQSLRAGMWLEPLERLTELPTGTLDRCARNLAEFDCDEWPERDVGYGKRWPSYSVSKYKMIDDRMFAAREIRTFDPNDYQFGRHNWLGNYDDFAAKLAYDVPWVYSCHTQREFELVRGYISEDAARHMRKK